MHKLLWEHQSWQKLAGEGIVAAGDIFPGCSNGFLNNDLSPMHFEEAGCRILLAPAEALYVMFCMDPGKILLWVIEK